MQGLNVSRLLLISAAALLGGAAFMLAPTVSASARAAVVGVDPLSLDEYGEPEPPINFFGFEYGDDMTAAAADNPAVVNHFEPWEFGVWWPSMNADLVQRLHWFREYWGAPVVISSHQAALGRHAGESASYHNVDKYGTVRAVDCFPQGLTPHTAARAVECAEKAGLNGIGLYTDTQPSMMMHLDNRPTAGRWARVAGQYVGINHAIG